MTALTKGECRMHIKENIIVFNKQKVSAGGVVIYKKITTYNNCRDAMVPCSQRRLLISLPITHE